MIWGSILVRGRASIVFVDNTMNSVQYINVLSEALISLMEDEYGGEEDHSIFQHDNASVQTAK